MVMKTDIVKINAEEFGLSSESAANIEAQFKPMLEKMTELEKEFNSVAKLDIADPSTSKKAKELRLKYVKVRTGTAEIHKKQKDFYLQGGRFVDGWKNAQLFASQGKEEALEKIEKHFENLEKEQQAKLHEERVALVSPYLEDVSGYSFGALEQDIFDALLSAKKKTYEDRIEAEMAAEKERLAAAFEVENQRLAEEEKRQEELRIANERAAAAQAEQNRIQKEAEAKLNAQRAEQVRIQAEQDAKLAAERAERERLEKELSDKRIAEENAEIQRKATEEENRKAAEKLAKAPMQKQLNAWVGGFSIPEFTGENVLAADIQAKFNGFKAWALKQISEV